MSLSLLDDFLKRQPPVVLSVLAIILTGSMAIIDYVTGYEISFSIFYLLPVALASWYLGLRSGIIFSILCAMLWHYVDFLCGHSYSNSIIGYWNAIMRGLIFLLTTWLIVNLKDTVRIEQAARQLADQSSQAKSSFLATMSHEIRTPLNGVLAMAELLANTRLDHEQRGYVATFRREGEHLLRLINDILDLSKIEAGQFTVESRPVPLNRLIEETISVLQVRSREKGIGLTHRFGPDVPSGIASDAIALRRILFNLLGNAIKFTDSGSVSLTVDVITEPGIRWLRFQVTDTGIGIPPEKIAAIFEPFSQADSSITRRFGGTGLGLDISRRLAQLLGGQITAANNPEGAGSCFTCLIPMVPAGTAPEAESSVDTGADLVVPQPLRILVADDYPLNQQIVQAFLNATPYQLTCAENGQEALAQATANPFDLILMDIQMPVMDGYEATRRIREREQAQQRQPVPIIALTAHAYAEDIQRSRAAGCTAHLVKPISSHELLRAICDAVRPGCAESSPVRAAVPNCRIAVSPRVRKLIPGFLAEMAKNQACMAQLVDDGGFAELEKLAHQMKGAGGSYGFPVFSELGGKLETAVRIKDVAGMRVLLTELANYLDNVEVQYD